MERRGEAVQRWVNLGAMWAFLSGFTNRFYRIHRRETDSYVSPIHLFKIRNKNKNFEHFSVCIDNWQIMTVR